MGFCWRTDYEEAATVNSVGKVTATIFWGIRAELSASILAEMRGKSSESELESRVRALRNEINLLNFRESIIDALSNWLIQIIRSDYLEKD